MYPTVAYWVSEYKRGILRRQDDPHSGRLSISDTEENIKKVEKLVLEDRRINRKHLANNP